jgi:hypothetical protein
MESSGTKHAAEALLRELPSVMGAFVREDVYGHPREIHLLIAAGPSPRHFARDIRDLLEERLGVPIDQRVISIAQLAPEALPPEREAGSVEHADDGAGDFSGEGRPQAADPEPRLRFEGAETVRQGGRLTVTVQLGIGGEAFSGEDTQIDAPHGRLRSGARALLDAANRVCRDRGRFALEEVSYVRALGRDFALLTVIAHAPRLGRKALKLAGAQVVDGEEEVAAALAALKAVNRVLALVIEEAAGST